MSNQQNLYNFGQNKGNFYSGSGANNQYNPRMGFSQNSQSYNLQGQQQDYSGQHYQPNYSSNLLANYHQGEGFSQNTQYRSNSNSANGNNHNSQTQRRSPISKQIDYTDLVERQILENGTYRRVPVRTEEVNQKLQSTRERFQPQKNLETFSSTSIVPVTIFVKKPESNELPEKSQTRISQDQNSISNPEVIKRPVFNIETQPAIYSKDFQPVRSLLSGGSFGLSNLNGKFYVKDKRAKKRKSDFKRLATSLSIFIFSMAFFGSIFSVWMSNQNTYSNQEAVAGVLEENSEFERIEEYKIWIVEKNGFESGPNEDIDNDELTNYEEFLLNSDPTNSNSCSEELTDSQTLFQLINPSTCEPIDLNDESQLSSFEKIISIPNLQTGLVNSVVEEPKLESDAKITPTNNLLSLFEVGSFTELNSISPEVIDQKVENQKTKKEYLRIIDKIETYVSKYRSYETYDRNYASPVHPAVYLEVSINYDVPMKYMLALARTESRFGTDRYTNSGSLTRPGQFQNIYSIGLTDGGLNTNFNSWEQGVEAFGKWYKKFEERGVSDCAKWRIYNPNGDYCAKIESLADDIETYLNS